MLGWGAEGSGETGPRGSRSPRPTLAGRSTSPPHAATAGGPARASGTSREEPGGPRGRATAEGRAGGGERRPPLSPRSRGAGSRAVSRACCCGHGVATAGSAPRPRASAPHLLPHALTHTQAAISPDRAATPHNSRWLPSREEEGGQAGAEHGSRCRKNVAKPHVDSAPSASGSGGGSHPF